MIFKWWRKKQREKDIETLFPAFVEVMGIDQAKRKLYEHAIEDPAWSDLTSVEINMIISRLNVE